jgi:hypothetical protein
MDWQAVENALQTWAKNASALPDASVIWGKQTGPRPARPFVELTHDGPRPLSPFVERRVSDTPGAPAGNEITLDTSGPVEFSVAVDVFTVPTLGNSAAVAIAGKMAANLDLGSVIDSLDAASVAVVDRTAIQDLSAVFEDAFEGRASFSLRLRSVDGATETTTYIETAPVPATLT